MESVADTDMLLSVPPTHEEEFDSPYSYDSRRGSASGVSELSEDTRQQMVESKEAEVRSQRAARLKEALADEAASQRLLKVTWSRARSTSGGWVYACIGSDLEPQPSKQDLIRVCRLRHSYESDSELKNFYTLLELTLEAQPECDFVTRQSVKELRDAFGLIDQSIPDVSQAGEQSDDDELSVAASDEENMVSSGILSHGDLTNITSMSSSIKRNLMDDSGDVSESDVAHEFARLKRRKTDLLGESAEDYRLVFWRVEKEPLTAWFGGLFRQNTSVPYMSSTSKDQLRHMCVEKLNACDPGDERRRFWSRLVTRIETETFEYEKDHNDGLLPTYLTPDATEWAVCGC